MAGTPLTNAINALTTYANTVTGKTPPDTTLSEAVATLASGYGGGGSMGGLANMVDVSDQNYEYAYMLMKMKKGETVGGTVTYTTAFPNTETKILETGLTTVHGFLFVDPAVAINDGYNSGVNKVIFVFVHASSALVVNGFNGSNLSKAYGQAQGTVQSSAPLQGAIRISGGDVYYTGRYNANASNQILKVNTLYEWLAW